MKLLDADRKRLVVELTSEDWSQIGSLFTFISSLESPNWWLTENGEEEPAMTQEKFDRLSLDWNRLTDGPMGKAFFVGR